MVEIQHGTDEWHQVRHGIITGSNMDKVLSFSHAYLRRLIAIRSGQIPFIPGEPKQAVGGAREWGHVNEPRAIASYELRNDVDVIDRGRFYVHPELDYLGGTPDGRVARQRGLIEVKCPEQHNNFLRMMATEDFTKNIPQCAAYLSICDLDWCDVVYYDPRLKSPDDLIVMRYERDRVFEAKCLAACRRFWSAVVAAHIPEIIDLETIPKLF